MTRQKNVLLLCADMASAVHFSCYGGPAGLTPAIDSLAANGIRFTNAYCACPPCIPARVSMLCGQYGHTHGKSAHLKMPLTPQPALLPGILAANGYRTGIVGKTHWWPPDSSLGCQDTFLTIDNHLSPELGEQDAYLRFLRDQGLFSYDPATWIEEKDRIEARNLPFGCTKVNWTGDTACRLLENYAGRDDPFFLFCSFVEPHGGSRDALSNAPEALRSRLQAIPLPAIVEDSGAHKPAPQRRAVRELWNRPVHEKEQYRRNVFNDIAMVDRNIGKILRMVNDLGLGDDLLVLFTTDHGDLMFDHGCMEKTILYERSIRVPFIVSGPGVPSGESRPQLASHVDLLPTVLDHVGVPERPEWNIEGRSLLPVVRDAEEKGREYLYCESEQTIHLRHLAQSCQSKVVRHGDLKYIHTLVDGRQEYEELYDLAADPEELENLVPSGRLGVAQEHLRRELLRWLTATEISRLHPVPENHYQVPRIEKEYL